VRPRAASDRGVASGLWLEWDRAGVRSRLPLDRTLTIGREAGCDVRIQEPTVSRRHATVSISAGRPLVDATGSTNGIRLDRGRADRVALGLGQSFQVGSVIFRVVEGPPMAQPRAASAVQRLPARSPRQKGTRSTLLPIAATGIVAVVVIGAIVGIAVLGASGGAPAGSRGSSGTAATQPGAALPSGWSELPSAAPGQVVPGWDAGSVAFRNTDGRLLQYAATSSASAGRSNATRSPQDHYAFDAPSDWQLTRTEKAGHDSFRLVPPGIDPSLPMAGGTPMITLTWSAAAPAPDISDGTVTNLGTTDAPVAGTTVYSIGGLGRQLLAVIPHSGGFVVVSGDASDVSWVAVFRQVLASWKAA
jgi:hypothetical protein